HITVSPIPMMQGLLLQAENRRVPQHAPVFYLLARSLVKVGIDELGQGLDSRILISAVGDDVDGCTLDNPQGEHAQEALCVHTSLFFLHPDAALKLVGFLNEESRWPGMKTYLILDDYFF